MQPLDKTSCRLMVVCEAVQRALYLQHVPFHYLIMNCGGSEFFATCQQPHSDYPNTVIRFYDPFFQSSWEYQVETIIHEHLHVIVGMTRKSESPVTHLSRVLFDLLKDQFADKDPQPWSAMRLPFLEKLLLR